MKNKKYPSDLTKLMWLAKNNILNICMLLVQKILIDVIPCLPTYSVKL